MPQTLAQRRQSRRILHFLRGDTDAAALVHMVSHISQVWDDIIDGDRDVPSEAVNRAFWYALVELPRNPFYARHYAKLVPLMASYINAWFDANRFEESGRGHEMHVAFVLRDMAGDIVNMCAYIVGGYDWMRTVSPEIRRMIHDESLGSYLEERS
ncbi:hypothetical protein ACI3L3_10090 [Desulfobaculum sp. SPO524]|uniref:hypothetical protein n=1 Tax=Desulfobaculum sp. SPO524 TaxID=3378071 RepID=UPI0038545E0F